MNLVKVPINRSCEMSVTDSASTKINDLHKQALISADNAVACAREAGKLLLEMKSQLAHGKFISWIDKNINVSVRQAQRYMALAQGKESAVKNLFSKDDSLSHLLGTLELNEYAHIRGWRNELCAELFIVPINKKFVYHAYIVGKNYGEDDPEGYCETTRRGISREFLFEMIKTGMYPIQNGEIVEKFPIKEGMPKNPYWYDSPAELNADPPLKINVST